jgi:hypothetical protein
MGIRGMGVGLMVLAMFASAATAAAAPSWQPVQTLDLIRGVPRPDVGINGAGSSTVVYTSADTTFDELRPWFAVRPPNGDFSVKVVKPGGEADAQVAVAPNGATAIAAIGRGRLYVTLYPAPGAAGVPGIGGTDGTPTPIDVGGMGVDALQLAIDGSGRATVVWASPRVGRLGEAPTQIYTATVASPSWAPGTAQALGPPGHCRPALDVNLRGDTVVGRDCDGQPDDFFYRPAGGNFGPAEAPFGGGDPGPGGGAVGMALDGSGSVHAYQSVYVDFPKGGPSYSRVSYSVRPPAGPFGPTEQLGFASAIGFQIEAQEDGDVIAAWPSGYAFRPPGGPFGPVRKVKGMGGTGFDLVTSPNGPALLSWRDRFGLAETATEQVAAAVITPDGESRATRLGLPGLVGASPWSPVSFAINDAGQAVGAWEQRCGREGASAVMAIALAEGSSGNRPPCQDRSAPKVLIRPQQARFVGRTLRLRAGCDEACSLGIKIRVLRGGRGKPLATAKLRGIRQLAPSRFRSFGVKLRPADAARVRRALTARKRVVVRLALSVRDTYENGAVRRVAVPLRR